MVVSFISGLAHSQPQFRAASYGGERSRRSGNEEQTATRSSTRKLRGIACAAAVRSCVDRGHGGSRAAAPDRSPSRRQEAPNGRTSWGAGGAGAAALAAEGSTHFLRERQMARGGGTEATVAGAVNAQTAAKSHTEGVPAAQRDGDNPRSVVAQSRPCLQLHVSPAHTHQ